MENVSVVFTILDEHKSYLPGYKEVRGRIVFDVKMDFTRKARWVAACHKTTDPVMSIYAGVVSRESIHIAFINTVLNALDVWAVDIQNAYLLAPCSEKDYLTCGVEWGTELVERKALIVRVLYGLKS